MRLHVLLLEPGQLHPQAALRAGPQPQRLLLREGGPQELHMRPPLQLPLRRMRTTQAWLRTEGPGMKNSNWRLCKYFGEGCMELFRNSAFPNDETSDFLICKIFSQPNLSWAVNVRDAIIEFRAVTCTIPSDIQSMARRPMSTLCHLFEYEALLSPDFERGKQPPHSQTNAYLTLR